MDIEREEDEVELVEKMDGRAAGCGSDGWQWTRSGDGDGMAKQKAGAARSEGQAARQRHGMGVAGKGARGSQSMTKWLLGKGVSLGVWIDFKFLCQGHGGTQSSNQTTKSCLRAA